MDYCKVSFADRDLPAVTILEKRGRSRMRVKARPLRGRRRVSEHNSR
jgi:hypothetical protein